MDFLLEFHTDVGIKKKTNQDSFCIKVAETGTFKVVLVALCDGMGGLSKGELASATVVRSFSRWFEEELPNLLIKGVAGEVIRKEWERIILMQNGKLSNYGKNDGVSLGTTVTVMLIVNDVYYIANVGDSRAYEILEYPMQITKDHTLVAREVELGNITEEQAKSDPRKNILLQCVGASNVINVDFFMGSVKRNATYFLATDGFRNRITNNEIFEQFNPQLLTSKEVIKANSIKLVELSKSRLERDNISVIVIKSF